MILFTVFTGLSCKYDLLGTYTGPCWSSSFRTWFPRVLVFSPDVLPSTTPWAAPDRGWYLGVLPELRNLAGRVGYWVPWPAPAPLKWYSQHVYLKIKSIISRYMSKLLLQTYVYVIYVVIWFGLKAESLLTFHINFPLITPMFHHASHDSVPVCISTCMMTSSKRNIFRVIGPLCGEFTGHQWIPLTKASDAELWCFFDLRLNERLNKQSWGWWFETPSRTLWRNSNGKSETHRDPDNPSHILIRCLKNCPGNYMK